LKNTEKIYDLQPLIKKIVRLIDLPPLTFGYVVAPESWYKPDQLVDFAILAEKRGFEMIGVCDHFHPWVHTNANCGFAWVIIPAIAERTKKVRVGTFVTAPTLRYNPAVVAQAFATLGTLYLNRIFLSLGTGEAVSEIPVGCEWPEFRERIQRLEEAITIIKALWSSDVVNFKGEFYRLKKATLYTRPKKPIPLYVSASGKTTTKLAGKYADGFATIETSLEKCKFLLSILEKSAKEAGRNPGLIEKIIELHVSYDEDYDKAVESCKYWRAPLLPVVFKYPIYDPREIEEYGNLVGKKAMTENMIISNSPEEHIKKIEKYIRAGFTTFQFLSSSPREEKFTRVYGEKVLPYLKETYGGLYQQRTN